MSSRRARTFGVACSLLSRVCFNGSLAAEGSDRLLQPIRVTENAVPGQRILVAIHRARLSSARLSLDYPGQADPWMLGREIQSIQALLAGLPNEDGEKRLVHAVEAIDFVALDRGDQAAFERSLQEASRRLQSLSEMFEAVYGASSRELSY